MSRKSGKHCMRHMEQLDICFDLIKFQQQYIPWSPPQEIELATTEPKLYHWLLVDIAHKRCHLQWLVTLGGLECNVDQYLGAGVSVQHSVVAGSIFNERDHRWVDTSDET